MTDDDRTTRMEVWCRRMQALASREDDVEAQHAEADEILCEALTYCGARDLVELWRKVPKWYA